MAGAPPPGPFPTVAAFHDYFVAMAVTVSQNRNAGAGGEQIRYLPQHLFPSEVPIVFTHGGFHPRNIIVSTGPHPRVVAIIGWEQAGWYPAYWELCKARSECSRRGRLGGWESKYLPWILDAEALNAELREWQAGALCQYWDYFVGLM
jgi:aminoglycoside phosphotransferase (APT) family kinase protein